MTARIMYSTSLSNHNIAHILKLLTTNQMGGAITVILGPVHTTPGAEFETEVSLWKCVKRFPSTLCWRNLKMQQSPVILHLYLCKTWAGNIMTIVYNFIVFESSSFSKCFPSSLERKASVFKFLRFEERFRKSFSWRISVELRKA